MSTEQMEFSHPDENKLKSDSDWNERREWFINHLLYEVLTITFEKADGTERVMKCTLDPNLIPQTPVVEGKTPKKQSLKTLPVYDIEAKGWRSFTIKSVKKVEFSKG